MSRREGILGNAQAQERLRKRQKLDELQAGKDLREVLSTPAGRRHLWRDVQPVLSLSYDGTNAGMTFNEGRRARAFEVWSRLQREEPELFKTMFSEAVDRLSEEEVHRESATADAQKEQDNG